MSEHSYDPIAGDYDRVYSSPCCDAENDYVIDLIQKRALHTGRVADIGCGTGFLLEHLELSPALYLGVDISRQMLKVADEKFPGYRFMRADMERLDQLCRDGFDSVICSFCPLNYCDDPARAIREAWRILKHGGLYFTAVLSPAAVNGTMKFDDGVTAKRTFTKAGLLELFREDAWEDIWVRGLTGPYSRKMASLGASPRALQLMVRTEANVLGWAAPNRFNFILLIARKS